MSRSVAVLVLSVDPEGRWSSGGTDEREGCRAPDLVVSRDPVPVEGPVGRPPVAGDGVEWEEETDTVTAKVLEVVVALGPLDRTWTSPAPPPVLEKDKTQIVLDPTLSPNGTHPAARRSKTRTQ